MDGRAWWAAVYGVAKSRTRLSNFTFTFHFHALEKKMATHSSVLAWRIPRTGEPGGLPSMGSYRVRHDWSDLAAAAAAGSSVCGILQARVLEWVAMPFSRGSSRPRDQTLVSHITGRFFTVWAAREVVVLRVWNWVFLIPTYVILTQWRDKWKAFQSRATGALNSTVTHSEPQSPWLVLWGVISHQVNPIFKN